MEDRSSLNPGDVETLVKLARSPMVKPLVGPLLATLGIAVSGVLGWVGAKIDVKSDVADLRGEVRAVGGQVAVANSAIGDVRKAVEQLNHDSQVPRERGRVPALEAQVVGMGRQVAFARGAALAAENEATSERKSRAGKAWIKAYDNLLNDGETTPTGALISLFAKTDVPNE
jgi:hypothetical protein